MSETSAPGRGPGAISGFDARITAERSVRQDRDRPNPQARGHRVIKPSAAHGHAEHTPHRGRQRPRLRFVLSKTGLSGLRRLRGSNGAGGRPAAGNAIAP